MMTMKGPNPWASRSKERVAEGLRAIAANPERYPPVRDMPGVQKFRLTQFPFSLLYINRPDCLWVVAVAPTEAASRLTGNRESSKSAPGWRTRPGSRPPLDGSTEPGHVAHLLY
jgi:hypothetical protein